MSGAERILLCPRWLYRGGGRMETGKAVLIEGNRILDILPDPAAADGAAADSPTGGIDARRIDLPRHVLLPGLINAHTHVGAGPVARGIAEDWSLASGTPFYVPLTKIWQIAYAPARREGLRAIVRWDVLGMLATGTTCVVNTASADVEGYLEIARELGIRTYAGPTLPMNVEHRLGTMESGRARRTDLASADEQADDLKFFRALHEQWNGAAGDRIRTVLGPASAHTVEPEVLRQVRATAVELDVPVTTHLCQAPSEIDEVQRRHGTTPARLLADIGLLDERMICAHGTYLPADDIPLVAESHATVAHCGVRKAREAITSPFTAFAEAGIRVAIGTDAFTADLVQEMRSAVTLGKIATGRTDRPAAGDIVDAATLGGAEGLGRSDLGRIAPGAIADLTAIRLGGVENRPVFDPLAAVVHYSTGADVDLVMVDGVVRVQGGAVVGADLDAAADAAAAALEEVWAAARQAGLVGHGSLAPAEPAGAAG